MAGLFILAAVIVGCRQEQRSNNEKPEKSSEEVLLEDVDQSAGKEKVSEEDDYQSKKSEEVSVDDVEQSEELEEISEEDDHQSKESEVTESEPVDLLPEKGESEEETDSEQLEDEEENEKDGIPSEKDSEQETENELSSEENTELEVDVPNRKDEETTDDRIQNAIESGFSQIIVSNVDAKRGDTVKVPVTLVNNPGVLGMSLTVSYEKNTLELLSVQNGEAFAETLTMSHSRELKSGCVFLWDGEAISDEQILDGSILILEFKILEKAPVGKTPIIVVCSEDGTVDRDLQIVEIGTESGFITVNE